jgi:hypothetical protein
MSVVIMIELVVSIVDCCRSYPLDRDRDVVQQAWLELSDYDRRRRVPNKHSHQSIAQSTLPDSYLSFLSEVVHVQIATGFDRYLSAVHRHVFVRLSFQVAIAATVLR